jgi:hypothetical protein
MLSYSAVVQRQDRKFPLGELLSDISWRKEDANSATVPMTVPVITVIRGRLEKAQLVYPQGPTRVSFLC